MKQKITVLTVAGILSLVMMPCLPPEKLNSNAVSLLNDPPFWEGSVELIRNSTFDVTARGSGKIYRVSSTTALGALDRASKLGNFNYAIDDQWYDQFGSLLVNTIAGKQGEGIDGWQYWVNYPDEPIPYIGVDQYPVKGDDGVDFFYGGFGVNPDTSSMLIRIHIHIKDDTSPPIVDISRPIGGIYVLDREIVMFPGELTIILGKITIVAEAVDELTSVDRVELFVDSHRYGIDEEYPFGWLWDETKIGRHIIRSVAYDQVGNHDYDEIILWVFA